MKVFSRNKSRKIIELGHITNNCIYEKLQQSHIHTLGDITTAHSHTHKKPVVRSFQLNLFRIKLVELKTKTIFNPSEKKHPPYIVN